MPDDCISVALGLPQLRILEQQELGDRFEVTSEISELVECINRLDASFIIVTNEVGMGLVPANQMGRLYRDLLGRTNQLLAERVDEVYLMVAGLAVPIKPPQHSGA